MTPLKSDTLDRLQAEACALHEALRAKGDEITAEQYRLLTAVLGVTVNQTIVRHTRTKKLYLATRASFFLGTPSLHGLQIRKDGTPGLKEVWVYDWEIATDYCFHDGRAVPVTEA